jgi:hypothetical protein
VLYAEKYDEGVDRGNALPGRQNHQMRRRSGNAGALPASHGAATTNPRRLKLQGGRSGRVANQNRASGPTDGSTSPGQQVMRSDEQSFLSEPVAILADDAV